MSQIDCFDIINESVKLSTPEEYIYSKYIFYRFCIMVEYWYEIIEEDE